MTEETIRDILDAVENYGDAERIYGRFRRNQEIGEATYAEVEQRRRITTENLQVVRELLEDHLK